VIHDGELLAWVDPRSHQFVTFPRTLERAEWADALVSLVKDGRRKSLEIRKVNGDPIAHDNPIVAQLERIGFVSSYRGWVLRD
jgi:ATP-dependent Lhr-like helicase